jgi:hypothetical protein
LAEECGANPNDIPAAAARYLAAERVAEWCHENRGILGGHGQGPMLGLLDDYMKAVGK